MGSNFFDAAFIDGPDRVDGKAKVTGTAKFSAEFDLPGLTYGVLVASTIAKGSITALDTKEAEKAPGVLAIITHLNSPKVPGYHAGANPVKGPTGGKGLQVFGDNTIYFNGQPIALVIADTFERAVYGASLVPTRHETDQPHPHRDNNTATGTRQARRHSY